MYKNSDDFLILVLINKLYQTHIAQRAHLAMIREKESNIIGEVLFGRSIYKPYIDGCFIEHIVAVKSVLPKDMQQRESNLIQFFMRLLTQKIKNNSNNYRAIRNNEVLSGFISLRHKFNNIHVLAIGVHPSDRRQGVGELLLITAINKSITRNIGSITLEVRASNSIAIALYKKYKFEKIGTKKNYYQNPTEDSNTMAITVTDDYRNEFDSLINRYIHKWGS